MQLFREQEPVRDIYIVPSGNYGNLTAGVLAKRMGFPIGHFIAASNANDSVTRWGYERHRLQVFGLPQKGVHQYQFQCAWLFEVLRVITDGIKDRINREKSEPDS